MMKNDVFDRRTFLKGADGRQRCCVDNHAPAARAGAGYQTGAGANLFFEGRNFNPFISAGGTNVSIGALAYWTADAIRNRYLKNLGPLVSA
jgi:hypothetical protein